MNRCLWEEKNCGYSFKHKRVQIPLLIGKARFLCSYYGEDNDPITKIQDKKVWMTEW